MKKFLAILLSSAVLVGAFAFVGCGNNSSDSDALIKPSMPFDKDMVTVDAENAVAELNNYYSKLKENGYGSFQAYAYNERNVDGTWQFTEQSNGVSLDKTEVSTLTSKTIRESSDNYKGKVGAKAALTHYDSATYEAKIKSKNPNLEYLNKNEKEEYVNTGIQNGSALFGFQTADISTSEENFNYNNRLTYFEDGVPTDTNSETIPCVSAATKNKSDAVTLKEVESHIKMAKYYLEFGNANGFVEYDDIELSICTQSEVNNFSFTAKKNDNKFFVTLKYSAKYVADENPVPKISATLDGEYSALIDLTRPDGDLPTAGINSDGLSLSKNAGNIAYPPITSEQLTKAVEEGKELTVNIVGSGDKEKAVVKFDNKAIPCVDGKVTVNGADIKKYIDEEREVYESIGLPVDFVFGLAISYVDSAQHVDFSGLIRVNY